MDVNPTYKAFLAVSWLFLVSSVFTLAKTLRDAHEAALAEAAVGGVSLLSAAGQAIAFFPNPAGKALLYNERVTR